jgi:glutathione peroxidase-family protein
MQGEIKADFQKYLIDESGKLVGVFAPGVSPLDSQIRDAISATY